MKDGAQVSGSLRYVGFPSQLIAFDTDSSGAPSAAAYSQFSGNIAVDVPANTASVLTLEICLVTGREAGPFKWNKSPRLARRFISCQVLKR